MMKRVLSVLVIASFLGAALSAQSAPPSTTLDTASAKFDLAPKKVDAKGEVLMVKDKDGKDVPVMADVDQAVIAKNLTTAASFGNNAWILAATALVFFMTIPGLALFYGGLVKKKNILSVIMQSFAAMAIVSVLWVTVVYSLAFGGGEGKDLIPGIIGNFDMAFLHGISTGSAASYISQPNAPIFDLTFVMFQCMFAVITPALIIGAFAERLKFGHFVGFIIAWMFLVYAPIAHSVWHVNGWLYKAGALDFAGGTVVHINAGVAGLVAAIVLGKRANTKQNPPHNLVFTVVGAAMLWFGWFGFNAGSGLAADGIASSAFVATNTATAMAAITWFVIDWIMHKKPTILGAATGAVAGLVAITPAAGFVDVTGALIIGVAVSIFCYFFVVVIKKLFKYDDSLDCFGVHGIGGIVGALGVGLLANPAIWTAYGGAYAGTFYGNGGQFLIQLQAVGFTIAWTAVGTAVIFLVIKLFRGRAGEKEQAVGLDIIEHNERAYTVIE